MVGLPIYIFIKGKAACPVALLRFMKKAWKRRYKS